VSPPETEIANKPKILHHRQNNTEAITPERQFYCQLNWMRFLNKFYSLFPEGEDSSKSMINLKFIVVKQLLSQL
jgi:hypothetical protein